MKKQHKNTSHVPTFCTWMALLAICIAIFIAAFAQMYESCHHETKGVGRTSTKLHKFNFE